jgi:hypothetical protein
MAISWITHVSNNPSWQVVNLYPGNGTEPNIADTSGTLDVIAILNGQGNTWLASQIPSTVTSLILTCEHGYNPGYLTSNQATSLCLMPYPYTLSSPRVLCREQYPAGPTLPLPDSNIAQDVRMPIYGGVIKFFYALQSTDPSAVNKNLIIDLWGWE